MCAAKDIAVAELRSKLSQQKHSRSMRAARRSRVILHVYPAVYSLIYSGIYGTGTQSPPLAQIRTPADVAQIYRYGYKKYLCCIIISDTKEILCE